MIDQEYAKQNIAKLGFLLILDAPEGLVFGIDCMKWQTGPQFKGLKLIPHGAHLVHYQVSKESHKEALWIVVSPEAKFHIYRFVGIGLTKVDESEYSAYSEGIKNMDFDANLGAYPVDSCLKKWQSLSSHITEDLIL